MDRESDGWDVADGLGPDEFIYEDVVNRLGSVEHLILTGVATGANRPVDRRVGRLIARARWSAVPTGLVV